MNKELNKLTLDDLIKKLEEYNPDAIPMVKKAYEKAESLHKGQTRKSKEPYIIHPLNVAYILAGLYADQNTVCAGLLHDTLEDTNITKKELSELFNEEIANLVEGVTNIGKLNNLSKEDRLNANARKIVTGIIKDIRIIIIKLADALHNMRTLGFQSEEKQIEKSLVALKIYVPLALNIGAYRIRNELEDISLSFLKPDEYKRISELRNNLEIESNECLNEMHQELSERIPNFIREVKGLPSDAIIELEIKKRIKNVYGIYRKIQSGKKIEEIHDLVILKVMVKELNDCYIALNAIHSKYNPINGMFKDYLYNPKTNMYRSLHTTVYAPDDRLVQLQIRTFSMDKVDSFGITRHWYINKGQAKYEMQEDLKSKFQFFKSIDQLNKIFINDKEFIDHLTAELFGDNIYVHTTAGVAIELPKGSTPIDFAYKINDNLGNTITEVMVNGNRVGFDYKLQDGDRVVLKCNTSSRPKEEWLDSVKTPYAKSKVLEYVNSKK